MPRGGFLAAGERKTTKSFKNFKFYQKIAKRMRAIYITQKNKKPSAKNSLEGKESSRTKAQKH